MCPDVSLAQAKDAAMHPALCQQGSQEVVMVMRRFCYFVLMGYQGFAKKKKKALNVFRKKIYI